MTPAELRLAVPATLDAALDPAWLGQALAGLGHGAVTAVDRVEVIRTVATKVRFSVAFEDAAERHGFCLKGLLDVDEATARGGPTCVLEADFYSRVAGTVAVRAPDCVAAIVDRERQQGVIVMRDLIADGATFCSALDPFGIDDAAASLEQIACLHAGSAFLADAPWIRARAADLARMSYITAETLQDLLDGPRGDTLTPAVRDANRLIAAMRALAERDGARPEFLLHGDAHAGNIFRSAAGAGLIDWQLLQRGGWALDVAYHLCAILPVETAKHEERRLLGHYLELMRGHGREMPSGEEAWRQYRESVVYGFFLWSITRRVDPAITLQFTDRLGRAVMRHDSHALLGIA